MISMEVLNDAELLDNLRIRFYNNLIFTYVGPTLLVVNPFKKIDNLFSEELRFMFIDHVLKFLPNPEAYKQLKPHVYAVAA